MSWGTQANRGKGAIASCGYERQQPQVTSAEPTNDPEWVGLPKNHEKNAGVDNRGCYDACNGVMHQRHRRGNQESGEHNGL
jgi:hypothetical protein